MNILLHMCSERGDAIRSKIQTRIKRSDATKRCCPQIKIQVEHATFHQGVTNKTVHRIQVPAQCCTIVGRCCVCRYMVGAKKKYQKREVWRKNLSRGGMLVLCTGTRDTAQKTLPGNFVPLATTLAWGQAQSWMLGQKMEAISKQHGNGTPLEQKTILTTL